VVGWTGSNSTWGPAVMVFRNTVRGENVGENFASNTPAAYSSQIANGAVVPRPNGLVNKGSPPQTPFSATVDPVNAVITATTQDQYVASSDPELPGWQDCGPQTKTQNYDPASRLVSKTTTMTVTSSSTDCSGLGSDTAISLQYAYDAENHHTTTGAPQGFAGDPVSWTPDGHAFKIGANYLHYDGDQLLFITDANGALIQAKTELLANYFPSLGQRVIDRGISGQLVSVHNGSFYGGVSLGTSMYRTPSTTSTLAYIFYGSTNDTTCWQGTSQRAAGCAPGGGFDYMRPEGFLYGNLTFQGARAIDNASSQWTTPDAYSGDVHDPASQKAFSWDRNNPYSYSDPSGFAPQRVAECECAGSRAYESIEAAQNRQEYQDEARQLNEALEVAQVPSAVSGILRAIDALRRLSAGVGTAEDAAEVSSSLRDISKAKGMYGLGSAEAADAVRFGRAFVGPGARLSSDGKALISADGARVFRFPQYKPSWHESQANFETRTLNARTNKWTVVGNGHLSIIHHGPFDI